MNASAFVFSEVDTIQTNGTRSTMPPMVMTIDEKARNMAAWALLRAYQLVLL
jgi:hypothetical protein